MNRETLEMQILKSIETTNQSCIIMHFNNGFVSVNGEKMPEAEYKAKYNHLNTSKFIQVSLNLGKEI